MPDVVYGASTADFTYDLEDITGQTWPDGTQKRRLLQRGGVALTYWTATTGGDPVTPSSGAASTATGDIRVTVSYPDVLTAPAAIWVDAGTGTRWRLERDLTATVAAMQADILANAAAVAAADTTLDEHVDATDPHGSKTYADAWHEIVVDYNAATSTWPTAASVPAATTRTWTWRGPTGAPPPIGVGYMRPGDLYEQVPVA